MRSAAVKVSRNASTMLNSKGAMYAMATRSIWNNVPMAPPDPILGVSEAFKASTDPKKINVGVGAYRDGAGKPFVLKSVKQAQQKVLESNVDMEYAPITGVANFVKAATNLAYGADSDAVTKGRVAALQSLSGTGALSLSASFFSKHLKFDGDKKPTIWVPNPTWGNHFQIYQAFGLEVKTYRYWNPKTLGLDLEGMCEDLAKADKGVVVLHACAHNPTGVDPSLDQWAKISDVVKSKGHLALFDNAYQGFASGDTEKDRAAIKHFIEQGHNIALCQSFAKNFGLYGQRVGQFSILCKDAEEQSRVLSQLKICARSAYSNPPLHGARIVATILEDPELKQMWQDEIKIMSGRIIEMRQALKQSLKDAGSVRNWDHITNQIGMFSFTGLSPEQCDIMTKDHSIFLTRNGRISMAGVTPSNVEHLAYAMHQASK